MKDTDFFQERKMFHVKQGREIPPSSFSDISDQSQFLRFDDRRRSRSDFQTYQNSGNV